jgi:hypothetical protein
MALAEAAAWIVLHGRTTWPLLRAAAAARAAAHMGARR